MRNHATAVLIPAVLLAALLPAAAGAICVCFPCPDCDLRSAGQINFVVMDRDAGMIHLVPNIRIVGVAEDFALVVPTPAEPLINVATAEIWDEAFELTRPVTLQTTRDGGGLGCGNDGTVAVFAPTEDGAGGFRDDGVDVIGTQKVGAFEATLVTSDDPRSLIDWLEENGYPVAGVEEEKLAPLTEAGWFFTAMKLDPDKFTPPDRWDANVDPVMFTYPAAELEVPLPFLTINRAPQLPMAFFVVDDHRTTLPGFDVTYANRVSESEYRAIEEGYDTVAGFLRPGRFLTRLDRTFLSDDEMRESIRLRSAENDDEFRRTLGGAALDSWPAALLVLSGLLMGLERLRRRATRA